MIFYIVLVCCTIVQTKIISGDILCSLSSSDGLMIRNLPIKFELNVPYTIILLSNNTRLLSYATLDIEPIDNMSNNSICLSKNKTSLFYQYKTEFVLKFEKNSTKTKCIQLR